MTRDIRYVLMDPTGNRTILVEDPVPVECQPAVAAQLMERESSAEQAGFLSSAEGCDLSLRMAGGEFCGNAAMSAAAYRAIRTGVSAGRFTVKVSGASEPVSVQLERQTAGGWQGIVEMPRPCSVETVKFPGGQAYPVVAFQGISHVILEQQQVPGDQAGRLAKEWCRYLQADALGLMFLDQEEGRLTPLVYVPAADTLFWESACGSGTTATGAWLSRKQGKPLTLSLRQPGGVLGISASPDGPLFLKGSVTCLYEKTATVEFT